MYVCVCVCVCVNICVFVSVSVYMCMCVRAYVRACISTSVWKRRAQSTLKLHATAHSHSRRAVAGLLLLFLGVGTDASPDVATASNRVHRA